MLCRDAQVADLGLDLWLVSIDVFVSLAMVFSSERGCVASTLNGRVENASSRPIQRGGR
jgi:hypothetical protein